MAILSLLSLTPLAARADRADDDPPPFALRLADSSLRDGALQRASLEKTTGAIFVAVSAVSLIVSIALTASLSTCPVDQPGSDCGVGLVLPLAVAGVNTLVAGGLGTALIVTGSVRQSNALRLGVAPTLNPHGAGMGLTLSF